MSDIFISYAKEDIARVKPLAKALESEGWSVWWDTLITPGAHFDLIIEEALESARSVIVVWSKSSVISNWVRIEAEEGVERQILLPIVIEEVRIPLRFKRLQAVNMVNWQGELPDSNFDRLKHALVALLGNPFAKPKISNKTIRSPIVGTFYRAPSPASDPFVKVGDEVEPETVVCIIEAMLLMNEIQAEISGKIVAILVQNGEPVEYDQPLFEIEDIPPPTKVEPTLLTEVQLQIIRSPIVGTFYRSPSPASDFLVELGDRIETDTLVCIIEAMKLMIEIQAEVTGTLAKIYVENGQPIEYGQPLFGVESVLLPPKAEPVLPPAKAEPALPEVQTIKSYLVGTFYSSPSPNSKPFVQVGDQVKTNTVVCLIEAMKALFDIRAEINGTITKILIQNGQSVEYGQSLFEIEPSPPAKVEPALLPVKAPEPNLRIIKSPIVGAFYRGPSYDAEPFVNIGDRVKPDTVICIIEAMKLMNEIQAEISGTITKVFVLSGEFVEYNQPLFEILES
jgi:biotin carboxyl carrier protein